jgi:thioredoxin 1
VGLPVLPDRPTHPILSGDAPPGTARRTGRTDGFGPPADGGASTTPSHCGATLSMGTSTLIDFNDANFDAEVLKSTVPVLVDFTATWCGPCQQLKPIVEELAKDFAGKVKMGKLDIDNSKSVPVKYGIMAVPTIILFKNGKDVQKITGLKPKADLRKRIEALVA